MPLSAALEYVAVSASATSIRPGRLALHEHIVQNALLIDAFRIKHGVAAAE